jgi:hypothetical protein
MTNGSVIAPITLARVGSLASSADGGTGEGASAEEPEGENIRIPYYEDLEE